MPKRICKVRGCGRIHQAKGYCHKHYQQMRVNGKINKDRVYAESPICKYPGCTGKYMAKGYCSRHYSHLYHYGYVKNRTKTDPNNFIFEGDNCKIELFNNKGEKTGDAIIDIEDFDLVKNRKWYLRKCRNSAYVVSGNRSTFIRLHKLITGATKEELVDHEDHDTLNNKKLNLRKCTHSQNTQNAILGKQNTSGIKNVSWNKENQKWRVEIQAKNTKHLIGYFVCFKDAKQAAINAREQYHGEFACHG